MKVEAEVKIKILDGEEQGKIDTFTTIGETDTAYTECGIIETLRLEWKYIHDVYLVEPRESDRKCHTCKHYTSGEYDGSCDSYICKGYSNWESEVSDADSN